MKARSLTQHTLNRVLLALAVALSGTGSRAIAQLAPAQSTLPNFDRRLAEAPKKPDAPAGYQSAEALLKSRVPASQVDLDPLVQSPKFIHSKDGYLTGPGGQGLATSAVAEFASDDPYRAVKAFLNEHAALFGHNASVLSAAAKTRESIGPNNGLRTVAWQQQLDGIPVFEAVLIANITKNGELVSIASQFIPNLAGSADAGVPNRAAVQAQPPVPIAQAIILASQNLNEAISANDVTDSGETAGDGSYRLFKVGGTERTYARLVWVPMNRSTMRLCWEVLYTRRASRERFQELIDAETGRVIRRQKTTVDISNATYRVYTSDSPSPFSPGSPTPSSFQPPLVSRDLVVISALSANSSPNGWINDGDNSTLGNNVDGRLDRNFDGLPDGPRPLGNPSRVFDFPLDLTQDPISYTNAAVVQLFYWCNWYHDRLYELGFTESAGNYQTDNFGRGGLGNDAIQANAQSGADVGQSDNAFFSGGPDGIPGSVNMFVFSGPTPQRDGDLDSDVILHEATHGTSGRLVGAGIGITELQTAGMGEGWSDFFALSLVSQPADDVNGNYAAGGYASFEFIGLPFTQNYYFGIRHYPYTTDISKNPFTFKDIDPAQVSPHLGVPVSLVYPFTPLEADEVHHQGEIWCVTLWEARANLVNKYGYAGNQMMMQLAIDGMKLGPANPNFLQARDAIILADLVDNGGANFGELWRAFAKRGMGISATSPSSSTASGVQEAFDTPGLIFDSAVVIGGNGNGLIDVNECNDLTIVLRNAGPNQANNVSARLTTTTPGAFVIQQASAYPGMPSGATAANIVPFKLSTSTNFVCGTPVDFVMVVKSDQDTRTLHFRLSSGVLGAPIRFDNNTPVAIPDNNLAGATSPILVSGVGSTVGKVAVSLYITHTFDSDLTLQLISPDGITNTLSAHNGGSGDNYGVNCTPDGNRTTFDDAAGLPVGSASPPFVGIFRPAQPLSVFSGKPPAAVNGTWQLHVFDDFILDSGTIVCWSLQLFPAVCTDGGGRCPGIDTAVGMSAVPGSVIVGSNLTYTITVTNNGPDTAKGVTMNQTLPAGVTVILTASSQGSVAVSSGLVTANLGSMNVGATATVTVVVSPSVQGIISSTATVASLEPDFDPSNNTASVATQVIPPTADLAVNLSAGPNPVSLGGVLTYTVLVTNNGPVAAVNAVLTNTLPANVTFITADVTQGSISVVGNTVICNLGTLPSGGSALATIQARAIVVGGATATSVAASSVVDPLPGNNSTSVTTSVNPAADLKLTMVGSPLSAIRGNNVTYTLTLLNQGPSTATGISIVDNLPTNVTFVTAFSPQGPVGRNGSVVTCTINTLPIGGTASLTIIVGTAAIPTNQLPITVTNNAAVSAAQADPNLANNTASVTTRIDIARPVVVPAGAIIGAEGIAPPNGFVDPGETVTLNLRLQNIGNLNTTNLVATLLATNGVTPAGTQSYSYGVLPAGGAPGSNSYTFTAAATGAGVTATLQLQDGPTSLGLVQFQFPFAATSTFANSGDIIIPDVGAAAPYPSSINVSGVVGLIGKVTVTLTNVNHSYPDDVDLLLVGPAGQTALLMSHAGDGGLLTNVSLTFDDSAASLMPPSSQITSGTYKPSAYGSVSFPAGGSPNPPAGPYGSALSVFNGTNANGLWSLYACDSFAGDQGLIRGGWSLAISTGTPVNQGGDVSITGAGVPNPVLALSGNLSYTFNITNNGPNTASGVAFTNALPPGVNLVSAVSTIGSCDTNVAGVVSCLLGSLGTGTNVTITIVVAPQIPGLLTNHATVSVLDGDLNQANNSVNVVTTVNPPVADLGVSFSSAPAPAVVGSNLVYTIGVSNNGPGTALGVVVSNALVGVNFVSGFSSPPLGVPFATNSAVLCNLGNLTAGSGATVTLTVTPLAAGAFTNLAAATTLSSDPTASNSSASTVITVVTPSPNIVSAGARLLSESFLPHNGTIEPGETVTVSFVLTNNGSADTANVMATLLAANGVTAPSGPQSYGALLHGGAAVSNSFTFTATGPNGGTVAATLHLQDGSTNLGDVVYTFHLPATTTTPSGSSILIPESGPGNPYPSIINISNVTGVATKVTVTLSNLSHSFPDDLDILLVGPSGQKAMLLSDAGGAHSLSNVTLTFDDAAAATLPDAGTILSGTNKPTDYEPGDLLPPPAPAGPYGTALSAFNGSNPNGAWSLYVFDDTAGDAGNLAGGWSLKITAMDPVNAAADLAITLANPVGSILAGSNFNYTVTVTNKGPASASGVIVTDNFPPGMSFVSSSLGSGSSFIGGVSFNLGTLGANSATNFTITANAASGGNYLNTTTVAGNEVDLNTPDNTAQINTTIGIVVQASLSGASYTNGNFKLVVTGQPNQNYFILASTDLTTWTPVSTNMTDSSGRFTYTDSNAGSYPSRYYRSQIAP